MGFQGVGYKGDSVLKGFISLHSRSDGRLCCNGIGLLFSPRREHFRRGFRDGYWGRARNRADAFGLVA